MCEINDTVTHLIFAIAKCTTIRIGISLEGFTYRDTNSNPNECPSWRAGHAVSDALPNPGISLNNGGMTLSWINAQNLQK
jgi:hypothetical protein